MENKEISYYQKELKPFKDYDVAKATTLKIKGYSFPIELGNKVSNKENRDLKPPVDHLEMINRFEAQGVKFDEKSKQKAMDILPSLNYYRLSVFRLYLKEDKSFEELVALYRFDLFLRESINRLIPPVEVLIKTSLAYFLSTEYKNLIAFPTQSYDALAYMDYSIYKKEMVKNSRVNEMLSRFSEFISGKQDKDPDIKHHAEYYGGKIPIWVLTEHLTIGDIATFVTYLDRPVRKKWVRYLQFDMKDGNIVEWVKTIQYLRNTGAHCSRMYGKKFNYNPTLHKADVKKLPDKYNDSDELDRLIHTVFAGLLIIKQFYCKLPNFEQEGWEVFLTKLEKKIGEDCSIDLYYIGFPENWKEMLTIEKTTSK